MDDYFRTAERMYDSAKTLHQERHFFNACYLAGYVYECYGKSLMQVIGEKVPNDHDLGKFAKSLHYILTNNHTAAGLKRGYFLNLPTDCPTMYSSCKWHPGKRYDSTYDWSKTTSEAYQTEMKTCWEKLIEMYLDGIL